MESLSLYLHIPFCERKCPYCDFYSLTGSVDLQRQFVQALITEIEIVSAKFSQNSFKVETIFFGGGTPSVLPPDEIEKIGAALQKNFHISPEAEITIEANPGTIDQEKCQRYREIGFNRISLGVQSFRDKALRQLGRIHTAKEAEEAIETVRKAGCTNLSLDLIFGIPNQTPAQWEKSLRQAVKWHPDHISTYNLIYESGTPFWKWRRSRNLKPLDELIEWEMYQTAIRMLEANGYSQYEISNFCLPGKTCRHNQNYWNGTFYFGFGPSAHSYHSNERWWNIKNLGHYINSLKNNKMPISGKEILSRDQQKLEMIFLSLRQKRGLSLTEYQIRFGSHFLEEFADALQTVQNLEKETGHLLILNRDHIYFTTKGFWMSDSIFELF